MPINNVAYNNGADSWNITIGSGKYRKLAVFVSFYDTNADTVISGLTFNDGSGPVTIPFIGRGAYVWGGSEANATSLYMLDSPTSGTGTINISHSSPGEGPTCVAFDLYSVGSLLDWAIDSDTSTVSIELDSAVGSEAFIGGYSFNDTTASYGTGVDPITSIVMYNSAALVTGVKDGAAGTVTLELSGMTYPGAIAFSLGPPPELDQEGFAWGDDDGNQASHTIGTQDANYTGATGKKILRTILNASGDAPETTFSLYYQQDGSGGYTAVPVGASTADQLEVACWEEANSGNATTSSLSVNKPGSGSSNGDKPSNPETGDVLIILCGSDDNTDTAQWDNSSNKPTGFTLINTVGNSVQDCHAAAFYRVVDGTEGSSFSIPAQSADNMWAVCALVKNGAGTPLNVTGSDSTDSTPTPFSIAAVTTIADDCLAFFVAAFDGGDDGGFTVGGTGWEKRSEVRDGTGSGNAAGVWGTKPMASSGGTLSPTVTPNVSDGMVGFTFAIAVTLGIVDNDVYIDTSSNITDGEATTARLTAPTGKSGNFSAGTAHDASNGGAVDITEDYYTEMLHVITIASGVTGYVDFRIYAASEALASYTVTPRWTIASGTEYNMSATIAAVANTPADGVLNIARGAIATLAASSNTPAVALKRGVALTSLSLASSSAPTADLQILRQLAAVLAAASVSPDDAALNTARSLTAAAVGASATPDNIALKAIIALSVELTGQTSTPDTAVLNLARVLAAIATGTSGTSDTASLPVARAMSGAITGDTTSTDTAALSLLRAFAASALGATATPAIDLLKSVELAAVLQASSSTPDDAALKTILAMSAALTGQTASPGSAILAVSRSFAASSVGDSNTADASALAIARALSAVLTANTNSNDEVTLATARLFVATLTAVSTTTDEAALRAIVTMSATLTGASSTPDTAVSAITRALSAVLAGQTTSPDGAGLAVARSFAAAFTGDSATPDDGVLAVARVFAAALLANSGSPDDAALANILATAATIGAQSATPAANLAVAREMATTLTGTSQTAAAALAMARAMNAVITAVSSSNDLSNAAVARLMSAVLSAQSGTGTADLLNRLLWSAVVTAVTDTSAANLQTIVLISGLMHMHFAVSQPSAGFVVSQPDATFAVSQPTAAFSTSQPDATFAVSQPEMTFSTES